MKQFTDPLKEADRRIMEWVRFRFDFALLDLSGLHLFSLPPRLCEIRHLQRLSLSQNCLPALPEEFAALDNLVKLDLSGNQFTALPACVGRLTKLTELDAGENQLIELPRGIAGLQRLKILRAENNNLSALPDAFFEPGALPSLFMLYLRGNPDLPIPQAILGPARRETRHPEEYFAEASTILSYYRDHCR